MSDKRYDVHGDYCPDDCMIGATADEVLYVYGDMDGNWLVTREELGAMNPGDRREHWSGGVYLFTLECRK